MTTMETETPSGRGYRWLRRAASWARTVRLGAPRPLGWFLDKPQRLTALAWMLALLAVGTARMALADDIIRGPDMAEGGPKTLFEQYSLFDYKLTVKPDDNASGWFNINAGMLHAIGWVNMVLLWACLGLLYGGLTLLEWFLNLSIYENSSIQIDKAVQMMADHVFWPLISATVAIGAFMAYAKWRGEGRGFISDLLWVVAAATLATGFAMGPSTIMGEINGVRENMANGVMAGSTQFALHKSNPVGYPSPRIADGGENAAARQLVSEMWSTFGARSWCYSQFNDSDICYQAGSHALANDDVWQGWMEQLERGQTPRVFQGKVDYIRGQDLTRTGVLLLLCLITIPLSYMLVRLVISGVVAVVGLLLMLVVGMLFLTFWPIEGFFRRIGTQYWLYTLGLFMQSLFITMVISGVMVISLIISMQVVLYGFFMTAGLHIALLYAGVKARSWLETLTSVGGAGSMGMGTALIARSVTRTVVRSVAGMVSGGTSATASAAGWMHNKTAANKPGWASSRRASADQPRSGRGAKTAGMDAGPLKAYSSRMRQPGTEPQITGGQTALPAGTSASSTHGTPGAGSAGETSSSAGTGRRVPPMAAQSTRSSTGVGRRSASPADVSDGTVQRNVAEQQKRSGHRGRVWVTSSDGRGAAPLDDTPPSPTRERRGVPTVTTARPRRRRLRRGDQ